MNEPKKRRFNIIDIIVLAILLAAVVFFAVKELKPKLEARAAATSDTQDGESKPLSQNEKFGTAYFTLEVDGMRKEMFEDIASKLPEPMMAGGKLTDGIIHSATCEECEVAYLEAANPINEALTTYVLPNEDAEYVNAFFVCQAPIDLVNYNHWSISQDIRIGRQYYLKTPMLELTGTVIELTVDGEPEA